MAEMQFWRLSAPEYESDYHDAYINGSLEHPYGLPGVRCDVCGETWGGTRVLPFECPEQLRSRRELQDGQPLDGPVHRALRSELAALLTERGHHVDLRPGDDLQPSFLDVPSCATADFLWASFGSVVVSNRVRNILGDIAGSHVHFVPVELRSVGTGDPQEDPPIPDSGEPEDLFDEIEILEDTSAVGPYWEMIVESESGLPRGVPQLDVCEGCGRPSYDSRERVLVMRPEMWRGAPIFTFATTLWIIVTEDVRQKLVDLNATNVAFEVPVDAA